MHRWLQISDLYQSKNQRDSLLERDSKGDDEEDDKPCDIQEQRFGAQCVLHPQLMSSINASDAGC
jgi:hypothetical protein